MSAIMIPQDLNERIASATAFFWTTRSGQRSRQSQTGVADRGNRGAVTGGKQLDGFVGLIKDILLLNGVPEACVFTDTALELPGYYRPSKKWDLLVVDRGKLVIAIELKSQVGPSFGNNFNNRTEEAMGSALDLWTAYREGVFGSQPAPWLGYFLFLENCERSAEPVRAHSPHFPVLEEFANASYRKRYEIFCTKLLLERQYSAACLLFSSGPDRNFGFPRKELSLEAFLRSMLGAAVSHFHQEQSV